MEFLIKPLKPDLIEDFFSFFDAVEFCEHPHWSICYCYSFHFTGNPERWNKENNRAAVENLIRQNCMKGYLVYHNGSPVGWCNANNRLEYKRLLNYYELIDPENNKICSIVCFLIHQDYRRKGITKQILKRIIEDYSTDEYEYIEAYPGKGKLSSERLYHGSMELYLKSGFKPSSEHADYWVVRKQLS